MHEPIPFLFAIDRRFVAPLILGCFLGCFATPSVHADDDVLQTLEPAMLHLRNGPEVEWSSFSKATDGAELKLTFQSKMNDSQGTLSLRQQDVKETWTVRLNETQLGRLVRDENDLRTDFDIPPGTLVDGENVLEVRCKNDSTSDDIRVGEIELHRRSRDAVRGAATIQIVLVDATDTPMPGRITITDSSGTLMPVGAESGQGLAVREGVIYTASGEATFGVQPGTYRIIGGRGFEYSIASSTVEVKEGEVSKRTLRLERQVDTTGWVASDTHVHTVTFSGHGDCTIEERMITLAGEGIELPIATDHNRQIDYRPIAKQAGVETFFTPVIGNEVTTKHGHFNVFPATADGPKPDHTQTDWGKLFDNIYSTPHIRVAILNHARDLHSNFRPFSRRHHLSLTGDHLDGWDQRFTAMELINSGAVQTDPMELFTDWCGLINHGLQVTPVGCSDSHDVSRYIVGQGRTYIQCDDGNAGAISIDRAVESFLQGRVIVSYGLMVRLSVQETSKQDPEKVSGQVFGPGDLVPMTGDKINIVAEVVGPSWTDATSVQLFVNGHPRFEKQLGQKRKKGEPLHETVTWQLSRDDLPHDAWITAVAVGNGIRGAHWPTAKPYQPDSPTFQPHVFSSTGPIRIDADADGQYSSPRQYAAKLLTESKLGPSSTHLDLTPLAGHLESFDPSVADQVMSLLMEMNIDPAKAVDAGIGKAGNAFQRQWRESTRARLERIE